MGPMRARNYAKHRFTGQILFFSGPWRPRDPDVWATWLPLPGIRRIGEDDLRYRLRCTEGHEARSLLIRLQETSTEDPDYAVHLADANVLLKARAQ